MESEAFYHDIKIVDKYLKKLKLNKILTVKLENYNGSYIYMGVVFHKRSKTFRTFWVDLGKLGNKHIEDWFNSNLMFPNEAEQLKSIIARNGISKSYVDNDDIDSLVTIESFVTNYEFNKKVFQFKRYIPKCWSFLNEVILILTNNMPRSMFFIYQIMIEKTIVPAPNYLFYCDKDKDNIDYLFKGKLVLGKKLYDKITHFERVKNTYYGIIKDNKSEYLTTLVYEDSYKEIQFSCTCGYNGFCEHEYASYLALINNKELKFSKIAYKDENVDLMERIKNFQYFLCYKIIDDHFIVVQDKELVAIPIRNEKKEIPWEIVEDDDKKTIEKKVKKILDKNS